MTQAHHIYDRVYLIGVDGAGSFFRQAETPEIDRIFAGGAFNHAVVTAYPTISAECWGSMLHGVSPALHGFMNGTVGKTALPADYPYPSVFKALREAYPDAVLESVSNWNSINTTIIEDNIGVIKKTGSDGEVCETVCEDIEKLDPKFLFVQFDSVDGAGHSYGYGSEGHLKQITYADSLIGRIYDTALRCGRLENTLLLVTADHGGTPERDHGGDTPAELYVSLFAAGKSVVKGESGYTEIRDLPSVIAFAFGVEQPGVWSSRVPDRLFADCVPFERKSEVNPDGTKRYSGRKNRPTPPNWSDYLDEKNLLCRFKLDGNYDDAAQKIKACREGKLYFTEGFSGEGARFDDAEISLSPLSLGKDFFTVGMWIKTPAAGENRIRIFSTKNDDDDDSNGLGIYLQNGKAVVIIGDGERHIYHERNLPGNYPNNWFHFMLSLDRNICELCFYYDFVLDTDYYSPVKIPKETSLCGSGYHMGGFSPVTLDEVTVFGKKLTDEEILSMKAYFEQ